jgi:hypothetical protein
VRIASHAIKGSALSVGAMEIGEISKGMEDRASEGDLSRMREDLAAVAAVFDVIKEQNPG